MPRTAQHRFSQELPQLNEVWHVALTQMRAWVAPPGETPVRPWAILVLNGTTGLIQNMELAPAYPQPAALLTILQNTMNKRDAQLRIKPHRPALIYLEDEALTTGVTPALNAQGIRVETVARPEPVQGIIAEMLAHMSQGPAIKGLLAEKGVTPAIAGDLFAAAAAFFRAEPWNYVTDQHPILVDAPQLGRKRFVIVMGAGGVEYGLAVYDQWQEVERLYAGGDPMTHIPAKGANALHFNPIHQMAFDDLDAIEQYGWEIADPEAYPMPLIFTRQKEVRRPNLADLQWYIATLRAIPLFVRDSLQPDSKGDFAPAQTTLTVPLVAGETTVQLTYPAGKLPARELRPVDADEWFDEAEDPALPDRRGMEGVMANMFGPRSNDPVDQAQELMYQAWDERNPKQRIALARKALKTSPDCADAYVLLAEEEAANAGEALALYEQGLAAGERALGLAFFAENVGHFWGLLESRPYMRARQGLATTLWQIGRKEEASQHYRDLLRLNPGDNQGIRYSLLNLWLDLGQDDEARKLLKAHDDGMAEWLYTAALLLFRESGAGKKADAALRQALKHNKHVPAYLTGRKKIPVNLPAYIGFGDDNEASTYANSYLKHWRKTPGAVDWLKRVAK